MISTRRPIVSEYSVVELFPLPFGLLFVAAEAAEVVGSAAAAEEEELLGEVGFKVGSMVRLPFVPGC